MSSPTFHHRCEAAAPMAHSWLIFDIGNTAVKWGRFEGAHLRSTGRLSLDASALASVSAWRTVLAPLCHESSAQAGIVSVVADAIPAAEAALNAHDVSVSVLDVEGPLPFALAYETPDTLGADRLAAAAGAWLQHGRDASRSVLVLDAGTALTCEVMHRNGTYLGGVIAPGPELLRDSLAGGTAQLPIVSLEQPPHPIGTSTETALQSGIMNGFISMASGLTETLADTLPDTPRVVLTGGAAPLLADAISLPSFHEPHLVLHGTRQLLAYRMAR